MQFIEEFSDYPETLSASSGRLIICGNFNINWLDQNDNIYKKLFSLFESFNLHQHIKNLTHKSDHLLDYMIIAKQLINAVSVSDFIFDHCAVHATIACTRMHPETKKITYRCTKKINFDQQSNDIYNIDFKTDCIDVDIVVDNYDAALISLLDSHAPLKANNVTRRDLQPWMFEEILSVKRDKRKSERTWRKTKLTFLLPTIDNFEIIHKYFYNFVMCLKLREIRCVFSNISSIS